MDIDGVFRDMPFNEASNRAIKREGLRPLKNFGTKERNNIQQFFFERKLNGNLGRRAETMGLFYALAKKGVDARELSKLINGESGTAEQRIKSALDEAELNNDLKKKLADAFKEEAYSLDHVAKIPFQHKDALLKLINAGHQVLFVTNSQGEFTRAWLDHHGFKNAALISGKDLPEKRKNKTKPSARMFALGLKGLGLSNQTVWLVGDAAGDLEAGRRLARFFRFKKRAGEAVPKTNNVLVFGGKTKTPKSIDVIGALDSKPTYVFADFTDYADHVLNSTKLEEVNGVKLSRRGREGIERNIR